jgi:DNA-binding NtrC family response regulator
MREMQEAQAPASTVDIAVLDDDADFRNYLEDFLKDEGSYSVRTF